MITEAICSPLSRALSHIWRKPVGRHKCLSFRWVGSNRTNVGTSPVPLPSSKLPWALPSILKKSLDINSQIKGWGKQPLSLEYRLNCSSLPLPCQSISYFQFFFFLTLYFCASSHTKSKWHFRPQSISWPVSGLGTIWTCYCRPRARCFFSWMGDLFSSLDPLSPFSLQCIFI